MFYVNGYGNSRSDSFQSRRRSSQQIDDDENLITPSLYLNKYMNKPLTIPPITDNIIFFQNTAILPIS